VIAIAIVRTKDLLAVVMLTGIYGLLSASFFVVLDAVDVAFTEASVGAGISGLLMLAAITMTGRAEAPKRHKPLLALLVVFITGGMLIYGTLDMPYFGSFDAPVHQHVAPRYINDSMQEVGVPNIVTSVLGSYRAFDTLGEVAVIFTAGIGVLSLLSLPRRRKSLQLGESSEDSSEKQMHEQHEKRFNEVVAFHGIDASKAHLVAGVTHEELPEFSKSIAGDVVVMGAVSRNRWKRLFIGATAERTLEHLPCDLLIVKPDWFQTPAEIAEKAA